MRGDGGSSRSVAIKDFYGRSLPQLGNIEHEESARENYYKEKRDGKMITMTST